MLLQKCLGVAGLYKQINKLHPEGWRGVRRFGMTSKDDPKVDNSGMRSNMEIDGVIIINVFKYIKHKYQSMKFQGVMRACLTATLLLVGLTYIQAKAIKPGATFEIECPFEGTKNINNIRTYAIVLNNGHKNVEVVVSDVTNDNRISGQNNFQKDQN